MDQQDRLPCLYLSRSHNLELGRWKAFDMQRVLESPPNPLCLRPSLCLLSEVRRSPCSSPSFRVPPLAFHDVSPLDCNLISAIFPSPHHDSSSPPLTGNPRRCALRGGVSAPHSIVQPAGLATRLTWLNLDSYPSSSHRLALRPNVGSFAYVHLRRCTPHHSSSDASISEHRGSKRYK